MFSLIKLIRPGNLLIVILGLVLIQYFIVVPILTMNGLYNSIDPIVFWSVVISAVLMMAGGFIINDYYDLEIDYINKPDRVIIGKEISKSRAFNSYIIFTIAGVIIGLYAGWRMRFYNIMIITPMPAALLWFYATSLKRKPFIGNFIVAFLCGGILLLPVLFNSATLHTESAVILVSGYAVFAFFLTLIREIIKDMEDVKGDEKNGCRTLPIVIGINKTKTLVSVLSLLIIVAIIWFQFTQTQSETFFQYDYISFSFITLFIQFPMLMMLFILFKANDASDFHRASTLAKFIMISGILSILVFWWLLEYF